MNHKKSMSKIHAKVATLPKDLKPDAKKLLTPKPKKIKVNKHRSTSYRSPSKSVVDKSVRKTMGY